MSDYFDREGNPIKLMDWAKRFEDLEYRRVAWDGLPSGGYVSTVWLGLNHAFGGGPPLIFETMVFPECTICERYATEEDARAGHARILRKETVKATPPAETTPSPPQTPAPESEGD
jgi:hypothetical protein